MDGVIYTVKGGTKRQHQVFDDTVCALKYLFPSLPGESKDLANVKKHLEEEGEWTRNKEVLG